MIFEQKGDGDDRGREKSGLDLCTIIQMLHTNTHTHTHMHTKCLVFKSTIWKSMAEQTDGQQCQPMCGNVCVIYGQPIYKMYSGKYLFMN